jgi:hypothetical protein
LFLCLVLLLFKREAPVLWRLHRRKFGLSRKHFHNAFLMKLTDRL